MISLLSVDGKRKRSRCDAECGSYCTGYDDLTILADVSIGPGELRWASTVSLVGEKERW